MFFIGIEFLVLQKELYKSRRPVEQSEDPANAVNNPDYKPEKKRTFPS
jgi:hypothetical protein